MRHERMTLLDESFFVWLAIAILAGVSIGNLLALPEKAPPLPDPGGVTIIGKTSRSECGLYRSLPWPLPDPLPYRLPGWDLRK